MNRYIHSDMADIWSDERYIQFMLQVEEAYLSVVGREPDGNLAELINNPSVPKKVRDLEKQTGHEIAALLEVIDYYRGDSKAHRGLTSSDITDTARAMQMSDAADLIETEVTSLIGAMQDIRPDYKVIGRTHGKYAVPMDMEHRINNWMQGLHNALSLSHDRYYCGKISGAVGNHMYTTPDIESQVLDKLGLIPGATSTQIVNRTYWLKAWNQLLALTCACEKILGDLRFLSMDGINEFSPKAPATSSSTMVHKKNPVVLETPHGLCRVVRGFHTTLTESISHNLLERDLTNTSIERVILPQFYGYIHYIVKALTNAFKQGKFEQGGILHNLNDAIEHGSLDEYGYVTAPNELNRRDAREYPYDLDEAKEHYEVY